MYVRMSSEEKAGEYVWWGRGRLILKICRRCLICASEHVGCYNVYLSHKSTSLSLTYNLSIVGIVSLLLLCVVSET